MLSAADRAGTVEARTKAATCPNQINRSLVLLGRNYRLA